MKFPAGSRSPRPLSGLRVGDEQLAKGCSGAAQRRRGRKLPRVVVDARRNRACVQNRSTSLSLILAKVEPRLRVVSSDTSVSVSYLEVLRVLYGVQNGLLRRRRRDRHHVLRMAVVRVLIRAIHLRGCLISRRFTLSSSSWIPWW